MHKPARRFNAHRFQRIKRWAQAMLAWLALVLFSETTRIDRRHIRQRYCFATLDWAERLVRALAIIRAVEITGIKQRGRPPLRNAAPAGFRRRVRRSSGMRATVGARFRKAIKARDPRERIQRLIAAFADIDGLARRTLVPRALRRLTKRCAVIMRAPPADAIRALAAPAPCAADSS
jgi:hypothetical protein